jgi:hypothetical protein
VCHCSETSGNFLNNILLVVAKARKLIGKLLGSAEQANPQRDRAGMNLSLRSGFDAMMIEDLRLRMSPATLTIRLEEIDRSSPRGVPTSSLAKATAALGSRPGPNARSATYG